LADALRDEGATSSLQLHHGGLRADPTVTDERVAPWADKQYGARALSTAEIKALAEQFVTAAVRAEEAGFDGVEVHGAHGYLIAQFLDPEHNDRADGYGGSLVGRSRFLIEILDGIRSNTGSDFQVGVRLSPERWSVRLEEAKGLAQDLLLSAQIDYLDMSLWDVAKLPSDETFADQRPLIEQFVELERGNTRLGVAGKVLSAADAQVCLDRGADFVAVGTGGILHHDFAARAIADPSFVAVAPPVSAGYLRGQSVSSTFIEYLEEIRQDFVATA